MENCQENEHKKFAALTMVEVAKQLITLASGFIVLSISFVGFVVSGKVTGGTNGFWLLIVTWIGLVLSISAGLLGLGAIAGTAHDQQTYNIDDPMTVQFLRAQQILFVAAFVLFICFAVNNYPTSLHVGATK